MNKLEELLSAQENGLTVSALVNSPVLETPQNKSALTGEVLYVSAKGVWVYFASIKRKIFFYNVDGVKYSIDSLLVNYPETETTSEK